jgi:uncharacterized protein YggE
MEGRIGMEKRRTAVWIGMAVLLWIPLAGQDYRPASTIEVTETASVSKPANLVRIAFSVEVNAATAGEAVRRNALRADALLKALEPLTGEGDRLETSGFNLNPVYGRDNPQEPTAYRVRNMVVLTSKQIDRAGAFIDEAAAAGANRIDSLSFSHDQVEKLRDEAAVEALKQAVRTADRLAGAVGMTVRRIVGIHHSSGGGMVPQARFALAEAGGPSTPIEAGEMTVSATVKVVFEIEK